LDARAATGLTGTPFIRIEKAFCAPPENLEFDILERHMTPDGPTDGPLVSSYARTLAPEAQVEHSARFAAAARRCPGKQ
jgi:hypothetical protein